MIPRPCQATKVTVSYLGRESIACGYLLSMVSIVTSCSVCSHAQYECDGSCGPIRGPLYRFDSTSSKETKRFLMCSKPQNNNNNFYILPHASSTLMHFQLSCRNSSNFGLLPCRRRSVGGTVGHTMHKHMPTFQVSQDAWNDIKLDIGQDKPPMDSSFIFLFNIYSRDLGILLNSL